MANSNRIVSESDSELVRRAAGGDDSAFAELAKRFESVILRTLSAVTVPEADRNDLYQEGLIALYKAVLLYDSSISSFSTFASVCVRSGITDGLRRYQKEHSLTAQAVPTDEIPAGAAGSPERILLGKEELSCVLDRIGQALSPMEKKVFGLHLQGKKAEEIARVLERDQKSVENTLFRARRKLKQFS